MPVWLWERRELKNTPSFRDNIDHETESRYRNEGSRLILDIGSALKLRYDTIGSGVVYFHRFFMLHSFKDFNRRMVAVTCLFLAGKVEETPKKCKDMISHAQRVLGDQHLAVFGDDPKEEICALERMLLCSIKFDLHVEHPYEFIVKYLKVIKADQEKKKKVMQMAWTFVNDSLRTTLCLQWEPEIIAIALIFLASKLSKLEINDWQNRANKNEQWWDQFVEDLPSETLEDICHQVLDLYATSQTKKTGSGGSLATNIASSLSNSSTSSLHTQKGVRSDAVKLPPNIPTMTNSNPSVVSTSASGLSGSNLTNAGSVKQVGLPSSVPFQPSVYGMPAPIPNIVGPAVVPFGSAATYAVQMGQGTYSAQTGSNVNATYQIPPPPPSFNYGVPPSF